jgi:hypothetical protein
MDPTSYILSFQDSAVISGQYRISKDEPMGPYLWFETNQINGESYSIQLGIEGDRQKLDEIFNSNQSGEVRLKVKNITVQGLPHKPAYNVAEFENLVKEE